MNLKLDRHGVNAVGFNGLRGADYVDEGNVVFGAVNPATDKVRRHIQAKQKNKALERKTAHEYRRQKQEKEALKKEILKEKAARKKARKLKAHNIRHSKKFMKAKSEPQLGFDFSALMGSPFEGFGSEGVIVDGNMLGEGLDQMIGDGESWDNNNFGMSLSTNSTLQKHMDEAKQTAKNLKAEEDRRVYLSNRQSSLSPAEQKELATLNRTKEIRDNWSGGGGMGWGISLPSISVPKISVPKISVPKVKLEAPKIPTLKQVGSSLSSNLKHVAKGASHVLAAPIAAGAHVLKQAGGHKLESGLKAATGVSVTQMARGGDATISETGKAAGAAISAPTKLADKAFRQVVGHNGVEALDRATGGTYTQAVNVGNLPGRAMAGEAISKKDWVEVASLAMKVAAVMSAGSLAGAAVLMCKQYAAKELSAKLGGAAGSILEGVTALSSGDISGAVSSVAQAEAKRAAMAEATKKLGPDAASYLAIGSAYMSGGTEAASTVATDIGKQKALQEVSKKTGLPIDVITAVKDGKVPSPSEMKDAMKKELLAAPDKLQAEMARIPDLIKAAPENAKQALIQKQELLKSELAKRDSIGAELMKKHSEELKKADEKIKTALEKTNLEQVNFNKANEAMAEADKEYERAKADPKAAAERLQELQKKRESAVAQQKESAETLAKADTATALLVAEKENMDNVYQAKEYSAAQGLYGVRTADNGAVLAEYKDVLPQSQVDVSLHEHPFLSAGLIPRATTKKG